MSSASRSSDQLRNSYQIGYDGSLRIIYASGLDSHYQTEPHILAGTANPTVAKRNMTLPGENGQNLVEWRFRKEQAQGKVNVFGRKLRVSKCQRAGDSCHPLCCVADCLWPAWDSSPTSPSSVQCHGQCSAVRYSVISNHQAIRSFIMRANYLRRGFSQYIYD